MNDAPRYNKDEIRTMMNEFAKLGFEVGYLGHLEGVGWVNKKLKDLEERATYLGLLDEVRQKYNLAKDLGKKRRLRMTQLLKEPEDEGEAKRSEQIREEIEELPSTLRFKASCDAEFDDTKRVSTEDCIAALANILKVAQTSHWVTRQLDIAFAGIADLHDLIGQIEPRDAPESVFVEGLEALKISGWISEFNIDELNPVTRTARITALSNIPDQFGTGTSPICRSIARALESIGVRAFQAPVQAIERKCICQGEDKCSFVVLPRGSE